MNLEDCLIIGVVCVGWLVLAVGLDYFWSKKNRRFGENEEGTRP